MKIPFRRRLPSAADRRLLKYMQTTLKSLLFTGALALSSLTIASAKSYSINLSAPTKAGTVLLKAGEYTVKVQGSNVVFTSEETAKHYSVPGKIEKGSGPYRKTVIETTKKGDTDQIDEIDLGGSSDKLTFTE
jgi:hypothetical protein